MSSEALEAMRQTIWVAIGHPANYSEGAPNCPGCKAEAALAALLAEVARLEQERDEARRLSNGRLSNIEGARAILWQEGDHDGAPLVVLAESRMAALAVARERAEKAERALAAERADTEVEALCVKLQDEAEELHRELAVAREREQRLREVLVRIERWGGGAPEIAADMMRDLACAARIEADQDDDPAAATARGLPPLGMAGILWVAAIDRVPIGERILWVKAMQARVSEINLARACGESGSASAAADEPGETP